MMTQCKFGLHKQVCDNGASPAGSPWRGGCACDDYVMRGVPVTLCRRLSRDGGVLIECERGRGLPDKGRPRMKAGSGLFGKHARPTHSARSSPLNYPSLSLSPPPPPQPSSVSLPPFLIHTDLNSTPPPPSSHNHHGHPVRTGLRLQQAPVRLFPTPSFSSTGPPSHSFFLQR